MISPHRAISPHRGDTDFRAEWRLLLRCPGTAGPTPPGEPGEGLRQRRPERVVLTSITAVPAGVSESRLETLR
ncbi:MAG: hypothetical protein ACRDSP_21350 [Pseudonocardiaceae bacterium]